MKVFFRKTGFLIVGVIITLLFYFIGIRIYVKISKDPIIFFASIILAIIIPVLVYWIPRKLWKKQFDQYSIFLMYVCSVLVTIFVAVFGPVFIDRSISYHIAFYAAEENYVNIEDIRDEFSVEIFDKRIHDAQIAGVIEVNEDGMFKPTWKAKLISKILIPIGKFTNSLDTYYKMKEKVK